MTGETVRVIYRVAGELDRYNNPIVSERTEEVANVLVAPSDTQDAKDSTRADATQIVYNLYFPKTFTGNLEGAQVEVRGKRLCVVGAPDYYDSAVCPTDWHLLAKAGVTHG